MENIIIIIITYYINWNGSDSFQSCVEGTVDTDTAVGVATFAGAANIVDVAAVAAGGGDAVDAGLGRRIPGWSAAAGGVQAPADDRPRDRSGDGSHDLVSGVYMILILTGYILCISITPFPR